MFVRVRRQHEGARAEAAWPRGRRTSHDRRHRRGSRGRAPAGIRHGPPGHPRSPRSSCSSRPSSRGLRRRASARLRRRRRGREPAAGRRQLSAWAARISPAVLMAAALGGFLVRMAIVVGVDRRRAGPSWVELPAARRHHPRRPISACSSWETRYVSGLARLPRPQAPSTVPEGGSTPRDARHRVPARQPRHRVARPVLGTRPSRSTRSCC